MKGFNYSSPSNILDKKDFKRTIVFHSLAEYVYQEPFGDADVYLYDYLTPGKRESAEEEGFKLWWDWIGLFDSFANWFQWIF